MIWDTGAHHTIITEDIPSPEMREYFKEPIHDPFRTEDVLALQIDAKVAFTNALVSLSAVTLIVSESKMSNNRFEILFAQTTCINHLSYHSISRH